MYNCKCWGAARRTRSRGAANAFARRDARGRVTVSRVDLAEALKQVRTLRT